MIDTLRSQLAAQGITMDPALEDFRTQQGETLRWALSRTEPYLLVNAPTGSGKTLLQVAYGTFSGPTWTYAVHTKALQRQVEATFEGVPVMMGRSNYDCWIDETVTAEDAICANGEWCPHTGSFGPDEEAPAEDRCPFYAARYEALSKYYRAVNYAVLLSNPVFRSKMYGRPVTATLLADEAHRVEEAVASAVEIFLSRRTLQRLGVSLPKYTSLEDWLGWVRSYRSVIRSAVEDASEGGKVKSGFKRLVQAVDALSRLYEADIGKWLVEVKDSGVLFKPVWGRDFVMSHMLSKDIHRAMFTSATLIGAEYIADMLGLPPGSWAYLDVPSTFAPELRPVNYAPVAPMNAAAINSDESKARQQMQAAIDKLIDRYMMGGAGAGLVHTVSHRYTQRVLTESRWRPIMTAEVSQHVERRNRGEPSVLVSPSMSEGWDGRDDLCRFIIMPKVPFPNLVDERVKLRKEEDPRSYDHAALVAVVQGTGRGVRHETDRCDSWILDSNWRLLYHRRKDWLPAAFLQAYRHGVQI